MIGGFIVAVVFAAAIGCFVAAWRSRARADAFEDEPTQVWLRPVPSLVRAGTIVGRVVEAVSPGQAVVAIDFNEPDPISKLYEERERGWMGTFSGRKFYPLMPTPDDVELIDVARGLAMTCRYGGQVTRYYSVAEHCVLVSDYVHLEALRRNWKRQDALDAAKFALLHDCAEAYIGDMIRPLKHQPEMLEFRRAESAIEDAVLAKFNLHPSLEARALVKEIDNRILIDEIHAHMSAPALYLDTPMLKDLQPLACAFADAPPREAEQMYLTRYRELFQ